MAIVNSSHAGNYTTIPNEVFKCNLSAQALGVLVYMLSLPPQWVVHKSQLREFFKIGRDGMNNIINELEKAGYFLSVQKRDSKGLFTYEYIVYDKPYNGEVHPHTPYPLTDDPHTDRPSTDNPHTDEPYDGQPTSIKEIYNKETSILNTNDNKEIDIIYIVEQLNLIAKKSFSAETAETKKHISARLKKYSKEDCVAVVKYKCKQWLSDLVMSKYIRPNTLFNESKFESYYQEMKSSESSNQEESYTRNWEVQTISQNGKNIQVLSNEEYLKLIELCKNPNRYPMTTIEKAVKTNKKW